MDIKQKLLEVALKFISSRRTESEVYKRLKDFTRKVLSTNSLLSRAMAEVGPEHLQLLFDETVDYLKEAKFLDDSQYALDYLDQGAGSKKAFSKNRFKTFLYKKGVPKEIIEKALNEKFSGDLELGSAEKLASKKLEILVRKHKKDNKTIKAKLWQYLAQKGFSTEVVRAVIDTQIKLN